MQRGSRDERGFTMVEMIITIAIMAILGGDYRRCIFDHQVWKCIKIDIQIFGKVGYHAGRKHDQEGNNLFVFI